MYSMENIKKELQKFKDHLLLIQDKNAPEMTDIVKALLGYCDSHMQKVDEGRLIELPCRPGSTVYTIACNEYPCDKCEHGQEVRYSPFNCSNLKKDYECPPPQYDIVSHVCEGFTISRDGNGNTIVSGQENGAAKV